VMHPCPTYRLAADVAELLTRAGVPVDAG
jgi:hypothetical protein